MSLLLAALGALVVCLLATLAALALVRSGDSPDDDEYRDE